MNHQIQHHVDIEAPLGKQAHAVNFEKQRQGSLLFRRFDRGVEPLQVTHLQDTPVFVRGPDQGVRGLEARRDRFFHEHIDSRFEQRYADFGVEGGWNHEADCLNAAAKLTDVR